MSTNENTLMVEKLFSDHATDLVHFLNCKLNNKESAEDIAQDAFARIQKLQDIGSLENPKAYLYKTAVNLLIDEHRREKLRKSCFVEIQNTEQFEEINYVNTITPERVFNVKQQLALFKQALSKMPANYRYAFLLHRVNGLTYPVIAKYMGVSLSSVEKYLIGALKHLRNVGKNNI